jgi:ribosomal protein S15P/S13E
MPLGRSNEVRKDTSATDTDTNTDTEDVILLVEKINTMNKKHIIF